MIDNVERYEPLGINCEFGFVLNAAGASDGGFFKWIEAPAESVLRALENKLHGLYVFENLVPLYREMVWDEVNKLGYHSKLHSLDKQWLLPETERRAIHEEELSRQSYLASKFFKRLEDPSTIFVLKEDTTRLPSLAGPINAALRKLGGRQLLVVHPAPDSAAAGRLVEQDGYVVGYLDRLAPIADAADFSPLWSDVLNEYGRRFAASAERAPAKQTAFAVLRKTPR